MSTAPAPVRRAAHERRDWIGTALGVLVVIAAGVVIGMQYVEPNKRVIQVLAAILVFGIAWRLDIVYAVGFLLIVLPYPKVTSFGNTNLALVGFLLVIWLLRFSMRQAARPQGTALDRPIVGLLIAYIVSFYNVTQAQHVAPSFNYFAIFLASIAVFYLITSNVRTTQDLKVLHSFQLVALTLILLVAMWEAYVPGRPLIPGWIEFSHDVAEGTYAHDIRVGGAFRDYELLAEFCGINLLFVIFMLNQRRSILARVGLLGLMGLTIFVLFATVTRGALMAVLGGLTYMAFLIRRRLSVVPATILLAAVVAGVLIMEWYVSNFTNAGSVFARFTGTKFEGLVPDTRASVWPQAVERWLLHPIIGSGPYYSTERGIGAWNWPHSLPLYVLNTIGVFGFVFFAWVLWRVWRLSAPVTDDLGDANYAGAFLLAAHAMLVVFLIDEIKIEYLRNLVYPFQVWILFANIVAARRIVERESVREHPLTE